jgi:hypothetical protein
MMTNNLTRVLSPGCFYITAVFLLCLSLLAQLRPACTPAIKYADTDEPFIPEGKLSLLGVAAITALGCNDTDEYSNTTSIDANCIERAVKDATLKKSHQEFHLQDNIQLARKRAEAVASHIADTAHIDTHPSLIDIDSKFRPREEWTTTTHSFSSNSSSTFGSTTGIAYPNIEIVAFPKAGTSQLYNILTGSTLLERNAMIVSPIHTGKKKKSNVSKISPYGNMF